tara:strand:- start:764 stop:907 length:144 start_codon:yes stop_codon:yes gene_type:complete
MTEELMMARIETLMELVEELTETVGALEERLHEAEVELITLSPAAEY